MREGYGGSMAGSQYRAVSKNTHTLATTSSSGSIIRLCGDMSVSNGVRIFKAEIGQQGSSDDAVSTRRLEILETISREQGLGRG